MSNLETAPVETECRSAPGSPDHLELIEPRLVPLGGPRAALVRRTLPARGRSLIGPWCFVDHYGPTDLSTRPGMTVPPHPHTGLQTVTWLFSGDVEHRDSVGSVQEIRPGQLNLMTAGRGISHSEVSVPGTRLLHGVQLWVALPDARRHGAPGFEHHADLPVVELGDLGAEAVVIMGSLGGQTSPATAYSPIVAAELLLPAGSRVELPVDSAFEHGLLVDSGDVEVDGEAVPSWSLAYVAPGRSGITVSASASASARLLLLGGAPFAEDILMWWNFVARTHEEVVAARDEWQAGLEEGSERFGRVEGFDGPPLPAPQLPRVRLVPRSQR